MPTAELRDGTILHVEIHVSLLFKRGNGLERLFLFAQIPIMK